MKIACDLCHNGVEDTLMQIFEKDGEILYVCPECYVSTREDSPDEQG